MIHKKICLALTITCFLLQLHAQLPGKKNNGQQILLPNGWHLTPQGTTIPLGDLPLNMAVSKNKKLMAVTNNGQSIQSIQLIDIDTKKELDKIIVAKSWYGLKFSDDGKMLFASGGNDNWILQFSTSNQQLKLIDTIKLGKKWPNKISPAGIEINDGLKKMYVVTKDDNALYIIDLKTKLTTQRIPLDGEAYACLLSPDKKKLFISCWGCEKVIIIDTKTFAKKYISVGDHPNELLLTNNGKYLYVANAGDNSVSVVDVKAEKEMEVLNASLFPNAPPGTVSNGLALTENEKTLFIANADNNCLAVFDVSEPGASTSKGFIPTGWYPTNVKVVGKNIFVTNGKGFTSFANPNGPNPVEKKRKVTFQKGEESGSQYIGGLMKGTMSIMQIPDAKKLASLSKMVYDNTPYTKERETVSLGEKGNPIPMKVGNPSPIKHVFYIVKENRTYDQVLGDMPQGNGDTSLVLFGEKITPNQHQLARDFVLLDNFYCDGEVSADGHNWSMAAHSNDYLEKNWVTSYGGRGGEYDAEGQRKIASPKQGFIWDYCKRAGVTYRTYGEFADDYKPNIPVLKNHFCPFYTSWDQSVRDTTRANQWKKDFDSLLAANAVPQLSTLRIINDHTEGLSKGRPTPFAHVADNDWGVGMFVDYLSHSSIWDESVVFILEDDAQNGADHVDAHRSPAYIIGPYVKRNFVDHTMYSTSSMLRTIELILGLLPMSQYDAAATPMYRCFTANPNTTAYNAIPAKIDITEKNTSDAASARLSATFDFSKEDLVPDLVFSEVIWKAVKGEASVMPAPKRSAFLKVVKKKKEDD